MPIFHPLDPVDETPRAQVRAASAAIKGTWGTPTAESRRRYDDLLLQTPAAPGVAFEADTLGGVAGWWCIPPDARADAAIFHVHGGGFSVGTARAYRHFAGQIAARAQLRAFIPDYRLAPEHPFPAGLDDAHAAYAALVARYPRVILVGDSAGGNLVLSLLGARVPQPPRAAIALSPCVDLAQRGDSMRTRADADPYLSPDGLAATVRRYFAGAEHDLLDPRVSPLYGDLAGLPPVLIHVGDDEILLDDALRYGARHPDCAVHVWAGMPHVFPASVGLFAASPLALDHIGAFAREHAAR